MSGGEGGKAKDFTGTIRESLKYLGGHRWAILAVMLLAVASTVFSVIGPRVLGGATDTVVRGLVEYARDPSRGVRIDFGRIRGIILLLLGLYGASSVFSYIQGWIMAGVTMKIAYRMRAQIFDKIHRLPFQYYDGTTHGEVLSRLSNDVDTVSQSLNQSMSQVISSVATVIGVFVMMLTISWQLSLAALVIVPLTALPVLAIVIGSQKHFKRQQEYLGHLNGHIEEMFGCHAIVKAFNGEEESAKKFDGFNATLRQSSLMANFLSGLMIPLTLFTGNLVFVAVCVLGGLFTGWGLITIGGVQAFVQYMRSFTQPITQIANVSNVVQLTVAAAERVFAFLGEEDEAPDAPGALAITADGEIALPGGRKGRLANNVRFEGVRFGYSAEKAVIRDLNADVLAGQKVAIAGPTGAGKTTIVKLLMRFYDVGGGRILLGRHDIREFRRDDLRGVFGMVLQDTWLFNGTVMDNIRYGKPGATEEEAMRAARAAQVDHFIRMMPDGYQTVLNEEATNVSQGQKQLITIARAILADPQILILDEATSNVDTRTEQLIQKAMDNLMKGRTSFVIAHRLSTVRDADLIFVLDGGDIVEQGRHEELLARGGFYARLYNSQFEPAA